MNNFSDYPESYRIPGEDAYGFYLRNVNTDLIMTLLDSDAPCVWVSHHRPLLPAKWWDAEVPIDEDGKKFYGRIRNLEYDLQISLSDFARLKNEIMLDGFELFQTLKPIPDTLLLDRIPQNNRFRVLQNNGVILGIEQPSKHDICYFWTFSVALLTRLISQKVVAERITSTPTSGK